MIRRCVSQALGRKQMVISKRVEEFPDIEESPGYRRGPLGRSWGFGRGKQSGPISLWSEEEGARETNTTTSSHAHPYNSCQRWPLAKPNQSQMAGLPSWCTPQRLAFGAQIKVEKPKGWPKGKTGYPAQEVLIIGQPEMTAVEFSIDTMEFKESVALSGEGSKWSEYTGLKFLHLDNFLSASLLIGPYFWEG